MAHDSGTERPGANPASPKNPTDRDTAVVADWDTTKTSAAGAWEQKRRLARAMRLVIERLVPSNAPEDELRAAADGLAAAVKAGATMGDTLGGAPPSLLPPRHWSTGPAPSASAMR